MTLFFVTIVKDGMPFISWHYPMLQQLKFDWRWFVVEGTAAPEKCTSWVAPISPGLSSDGTTEYLEALSDFDRRVVHIKGSYWHGKVAMFNAALKWIYGQSLLWQLDSDEVWTFGQVSKTVEMFRGDETKTSARFYCRYFLGPDIVITSRDGYGNNSSYEWNRVWKVTPGVRFQTHEPPRLEAFNEVPFTHAETEKLGLVFDHFAYATESQVKFKEKYYGSKNNKSGSLYAGAVDGWKRLQSNVRWPCNVKEFLPWVGDGVVANKV